MTEMTAAPVAVATGSGEPNEVQRRRRRAFFGAITGHLIEWYDYGVYGFLAVYIGQAFFASDSPAVNLISSFAVFALSFFIRPLGGLIFGPLADRVGRKRTLMIVLVLMGTSTFVIGLLPTSASIGIFAPVLLVLIRCVQGLSAGGEVGTAVSYIAEYGGPSRRGFSTSWIGMATVVGLLLGSLVSNGLIYLLGVEAMHGGGWRIPFLVAGPLGMIALYIRMKLEDSPEFIKLEEHGTKSKTPLREVMKWKRAMAIVFMFAALQASVFYLIMTFSSTYMSNMLGFDSGTTLFFVFLAGTIAAIIIPIGGRLSDRQGRKPMMLVGGTLCIGTLIWFFLSVEGATPSSLLPPLLMVTLAYGVYAAPAYALMIDLLPTHIRSTGIAVAYNFPVAVFGGSAPMIATALINSTDTIVSPVYFFVGSAVVSVVGLLILSPKDLQRSAEASERALTGQAQVETPHPLESRGSAV